MFLNEFPQTFSNLKTLFQVCIWKKDAKLLATVSGEGVTLTNTVFPNEASFFFEDEVPCIVTVVIVELFKEVQIKNDECERISSHFAFFYFKLQLVVEVSFVIALGETVGICLFMKLVISEPFG